jgi:uncharacterized protein DUF642
MKEISMNAPTTKPVGSLIAALLSAAALLPQAAHAAPAAPVKQFGPNIVANGGFEIGADPGSALGIPAGAPLLTGWMAVSSEVRVVGSGWQAEEGGRSLSLANPGPAAGDPSIVSPNASGVKQTIQTKVGQRYRVSFYQAGNPYDHQPAVLRMQIGATAKDFTFQSDATATPKKMQWVKRSFVYKASATSTLLAFYAYYTPGNDPLGVDNVQVRAIRPTPSTGA